MLPECGPETMEQLDDHERRHAAVFWWARQQRMGLKDRINNRFFVGPRMSRNKTGLWVPEPMDGCDNNRPEATERVNKKGEKSFYIHPWSLWLHCRTAEHVAFMVRHRLLAVRTWLSQLGDGTTAHRMMMAIKEKPEQMIESEIQAVRDIAEHHHRVGNPFLEGIVPRPHGRYRLALKDQKE